MKRILLIDDDATTHALIKNVLKNEMVLISYYNIEDASTSLDLDSAPDLVIIDRVLPDGDGITLCTKIRSNERLANIPIIFLSGKTTENDKVSGFFAGADDYVTKPFSPVELKARIQAKFRAQEKNIFLGNLMIDIQSHRVYAHLATSTEIELTKIEFKILMLFARESGRLFSRDFILTKVWGVSTNLSDRVVDTHISHLRKKISATNVKIEALRGEGYRLVLSKSHSSQAA